MARAQAGGGVLTERSRALILVALAELLGMSLWFTASAVAPRIAAEWRLGEGAASWLTLAVQIGFVAGTLVSAMMNLPDVISPRLLFAVCALLAAVANALFAILAHGAASGIALRFLTGALLAGVYPPGMKVIATWFREGRGFALGVLVGALTFGKASPYLVNAIGSKSWRVNVGAVSVLAAIGGIIILLFVRDGPYARPGTRFDLSRVTPRLRSRGAGLAQ